ncbi:hypothetical protein SEES3845_007010 [Salmonella enterica subsp. enterica serovar Senftenberg str. ATCC 43845]|nr:hypothetical protein SEES3845_007010 [Salmonella enterica subsp. enterica serovar Senftenberg str. ATCC 43845]
MMFLAQISYEDIEKYADGMLYGFICGDKIARGSPEAALACLVRATNHRRQRIRRPGKAPAATGQFPTRARYQQPESLPINIKPIAASVDAASTTVFRQIIADNRWQIAPDARIPTASRHL